MSAHTPGPWTWRDTGESYGGNQKHLPSNSRLGTNNLRVLCADHVTRADAHLIAAAPDLLAALEAVEWSIVASNGDSLCPICRNDEALDHDAGCFLSAAIAKARGRSDD